MMNSGDTRRARFPTPLSRGVDEVFICSHEDNVYGHTPVGEGCGDSKEFAFCERFTRASPQKLKTEEPHRKSCPHTLSYTDWHLYSNMSTKIYPFPTTPTKESQADQGIHHTIMTCECGTSWRSQVRSLCPTCGEEGEPFTLDARQNSNLYVAIYGLEVSALIYTTKELQEAKEAFRVLLHENAPWYDKTSRTMIQACYQNICLRGGTSPKAALALAFFEEDFLRA